MYTCVCRIRKREEKTNQVRSFFAGTRPTGPAFFFVHRHLEGDTGTWRVARFRFRRPVVVEAVAVVAAAAAYVAVCVAQVNFPAEMKTNQVNLVSFLLCTQHKPRHHLSGIIGQNHFRQICWCSVVQLVGFCLLKRSDGKEGDCAIRSLYCSHFSSNYHNNQPSSVFYAFTIIIISDGSYGKGREQKENSYTFL